MLIRVVYNNFKFDFVKPFRLDEFLDSGRILMFRRKSGWVYVGIDPIRAQESMPFRRQKERRRRNDNA